MDNILFVHKDKNLEFLKADGILGLAPGKSEPNFIDHLYNLGAIKVPSYTLLTCLEK